MDNEPICKYCGKRMAEARWIAAGDTKVGPFCSPECRLDWADFQDRQECQKAED